MAGMVLQYMNFAADKVESAKTSLAKDGADWKAVRAELQAADTAVGNALTRYREKSAKRKPKLKQLLAFIKEIKEACAAHDAGAKDDLQLYAVIANAMRIVVDDLKFIEK